MSQIIFAKTSESIRRELIMCQTALTNQAARIKKDKEEREYDSSRVSLCF